MFLLMHISNGEGIILVWLPLFQVNDWKNLQNYNYAKNLSLCTYLVKTQRTNLYPNILYHDTHNFYMSITGSLLPWRPPETKTNF